MISLTLINENMVAFCLAMLKSSHLIN